MPILSTIWFLPPSLYFQLLPVPYNAVKCNKMLSKMYIPQKIGLVTEHMNKFQKEGGGGGGGGGGGEGEICLLKIKTVLAGLSCPYLMTLECKSLTCFIISCI
jgi:hypothetical protein